MKWKGPIKKIDSSKLDGLQWQELVGKDYLSRYGTILLTRKGKVIAVCSLVILHRTGIFMCAAEEIEYGLEVQKIRRRHQLQSTCGTESVRENMILKEWTGGYAL